MPEAILHIVNFVLSFGVITLLFAMMYKILPDVKIGWGDVWIGAAMTALLFSVGKFLIGLYLGKSGVASAYGAAGSLVERRAGGQSERLAVGRHPAHRHC